MKEVIKNATLTIISMGCMYALLWLYSLAAIADNI